MYKDVQRSIFKYLKNLKQYGNDTSNYGTTTQWNTLQPCQILFIKMLVLACKMFML